MARLPEIQIDSSPASVAEMMTRGFFHSHPDGRWRYSPFGGETAHCNDPTEHFPLRASFSHGWGAAACPDHKIFARYYGDGTRGLTEWEDRRERLLARTYAPRHAGEREQRAWIARAFGTEF